MKEVVTVFIVLALLIPLHGADQIIINEIMYNSQGTDVEFIELLNISDANINLSNWSILDDNDSHEKCPLAGTLAAGDYLVIVGDKTRFSAVYPQVDKVNQYDYNPQDTGWALGNNGDVVRLYDAGDNIHDIVIFNDGGTWPGSADGNGPSLELLHPSLDNNLPTSWDPSAIMGGTPGQQNSVYTTNVSPTCKNGERFIDLPKSSDAVTVTVKAYDTEGLAKVELFVNTGSDYQPLLMNDQGNDGDKTAGDSLYSVRIPPQSSGTVVKYYALATDDVGQTESWPNLAPFEYEAYTVDFTLPPLRITEVLAVNNFTLSDNAGDYDDWFEIYNGGTKAINLQGMYVADLLNSNKMFELPSITIAGGDYIVLWADNEIDEGPLHTNFRLTSEGESIALFETIDHGNVLIHGWKFGRMSADISMGYLTSKSTAPDYLARPTPGEKNDTSPLFSPVCINEFQCTSDFGGPDDWIEFYNRGDTPFDLSGCFLSDQRSDITKWSFPLDTVLQPGQFLVVWEDVLGFGLASDGQDVIMLTAADSTTGLDFYDFGPQEADKSEGRLPDGSGEWFRFKPPTRGVKNANPTAIQDNHPMNQPTTMKLYQNYPNPFNPSTTISFSLCRPGRTSLKIVDVLGKNVEILWDSFLPAGEHRFNWDGREYASGIYLYILETNERRVTKSMLLIK